MPIFTRNPLLLGGESIETESTLGEAFQAGTYTMYEGLLGATGRREELQFAEGNFGAATASEYSVRRDLAKLRPLSPELTPEQARQRLRDNGLDQNLSIPETGIREQTLNILMDRKRDELKRQTIFSQSSGASSLVATLTGGLVGSFVDPTNIALAFVPVVGEARYAQLLSRAGGIVGRTGIRGGVGAVEGFVGLAPVEALNYYAHQQQQSDYGAYDSMVAIAGGAFFGSALHGGAGLLGEAVRGFKPVQRQPATLELVTDTAPSVRPERPPPSVLTPEQYERSLVMDRLAEGKPVTRAQAMEAARPRTGAEAGQVIDTRLSELERASTDGLLDPDKVRALVAEADELEALVRAQDAAAKKGLQAPGSRLTTEERAFADQRRTEIKAELEKHRTAQGAQKELADLNEKLGKIDSDSELIKLSEKLMPKPEGVEFVESLSSAIRKALEDDPLMPIRPFIAGLDAETQARALRMALAQAASGRPIDIAPALFSDPKYLNQQAALDAASRNATMVDGANPEAAKWADTVKPLEDDIETARTQVADEEAMILDMMNSAGVQMSKPFADSIAQAELAAKKQGGAAKAAAMCMMRTGG